MPKTIKNAKTVQDRSRGIEVLHVVKENENGVAYAVRSGSDESVVYTTGIMRHPVRPEEYTTFCNCKWGSFKKPRNGESCACSHVAAVLSHHAKRQDESAKTKAPVMLLSGRKPPTLNASIGRRSTWKATTSSLP